MFAKKTVIERDSRHLLAYDVCYDKAMRITVNIMQPREIQIPPGAVCRVQVRD